MNPAPKTLKEILVEDLNPAFVKGLIAGMEGLYPDCYASMKEDTGLGEVQAKWVQGYYRRARAESLFQRTAVQYGLTQRDVQPAGGGPSHISVSQGHFELVMCHVPTNDAFPQHSSDREQSSHVNEFIAQMDMLVEPVQAHSNEFFGIIIHTEVEGKKDTFGSIKIGFPNHEFNGWVEEPICLREISDMQSIRFQKKQDLHAQIQDDVVKWKKPAEEKKDDSNSSKGV